MFRNCRIEGVNVNPDDYHGSKAERGKPEFIMSPSSIKSFMGCPSRWLAGYESPETDAKDWGNLIDCLILTPGLFDARYRVRPETFPDAKGNPSTSGNTTACKEWLKACKEDGFEVITKDELSNAKEAAKRLQMDETIASFIESCDKQVHVTGEWVDKNGIIVPVQCLIDLAPRNDSEFRKVLGDLKSTRNAGQRQFARWCFTAWYHVQAAFDIDLYMAAVNPENRETGEGRCNWIFVLSENFAPYETGRRMLSESFLDIGRQAYAHALGMYARCLKTGNWSGYDPAEEFTLINPEPFMEFEALSGAIEADQIEAQANFEPSDITP